MWTQKTEEIKSIIDYVITKQRSTAQVMDVRVFRGAECGSDHYLVKGTIFWP
jgi:endonuclease/exonuclease/phosphatase family metal-dependent hydrolase